MAAIVDTADAAIIGKDLSGIVTSWNRAAERMFGYCAAEMIGRSIEVLFPPERRSEERTILEGISRGEGVRHLETEHVRKDGTRIPVSLTISPIMDESGRIVGASRIARDLSEHQREQTLLRAVVTTLPSALIVTSEEGAIQSLNPAAERMFGLPEAEARGRAIDALLPCAARRGGDAPWNGAGAATVERVGEGRRRDGASFPVTLAIGEVKLADRRLFVWFARDLTMRREREQRIAELQSQYLHIARLNELGQMASMFVHELSQPLAAMANYRSVLRALLKADRIAEARGIVERIAAQAERAHLMIARLRTLVHKGEETRELVELRECIDAALALALVGLREGLKLTVVIAPDADRAMLDRVQIQQVLLNLARNAAEAMVGRSRRELSITTAAEGEMVAIEVADTGPGLPERVRDHLFEPFVTTKTAGLGVGLSVCRTIVEAHGGTLSARDGPEGGTIFRLTLRRGEVSSGGAPKS